ncbi:MAG: alcohol dehydrogenase catalytic domain-containing protein, partial [Planctomycetaceae bacterium]
MKAMLLDRVGTVETESTPRYLADVSEPAPADDEVLLRVQTCGVCHTELDEIEGRAPPARLPIILGHQVVGRVVALGKDVGQWHQNDRVGVAWIFRACGTCSFCKTGRENPCPQVLA